MPDTGSVNRVDMIYIHADVSNACQMLANE